jgi:hypothetical protein
MTSTQPPTVTVRATRRGQFIRRTYDDQGKLVQSIASIVEPGQVFDVPLESLALEEDHGDQYHGGSGWMVLVDPEELLPLLPADEAALWRRRRAAADLSTHAAHAEHAAAHKALVDLRRARNPMPPHTELKPQTMDTPNEQWRPQP